MRSAAARWPLRHSGRVLQPAPSRCSHGLWSGRRGRCAHTLRNKKSATQTNASCAQLADLALFLGPLIPCVSSPAWEKNSGQDHEDQVVHQVQGPVLPVLVHPRGHRLREGREAQAVASSWAPGQGPHVRQVDSSSRWPWLLTGLRWRVRQGRGEGGPPLFLSFPRLPLVWPEKVDPVSQATFALAVMSEPTWCWINSRGRCLSAFLWSDGAPSANTGFSLQLCLPLSLKKEEGVFLWIQHIGSEIEMSSSAFVFCFRSLH